jgi:hypothetical protein
LGLDWRIDVAVDISVVELPKQNAFILALGHCFTDGYVCILRGWIVGRLAWARR